MVAHIGPTTHWSDGPLVLRYRIAVDNKFDPQLFYEKTFQTVCKSNQHQLKKILC